MRRAIPLLLVLFALPVGAEETHAQLKAIEAALEAWDVPRAATLVEELAAAAPDAPGTLLMRGRVKLEQGAYDEAATLFEQAGVPDGPTGYLGIARASARITGDFAKAESEHFTLLYPKGKDEILVPYALETLEKAHEKIGAIVGLRPSGPKIRVEIVENARALSELSTLSIEAIKTTGTIAVCKFDKLMITSPKALLRGYEWRDTLVHEYTHLIVSRKSGNRTPIWLHEGMAKFLETAWRGDPGKALELPAQALLRDAVRANELITFERMHPSIALLPSAREAALAFAEVFAAIEFLQGREPGSIEKILTALAAGSSDQAAVAAVFGAPFPTFERAWRRYLKTRRYPTETASLEPMSREFREDAPKRKAEEKEKDATDRGQFAGITDAKARKLAHLGELLRARGKTAAAAAKFGDALERTGAIYPTLTNKYALTMIELSAYGEAKKALEASRTLYPGFALTNLNLARVSMKTGEFSHAREFLEQVISVDPFDPEVQGRLLEVAKELGDDALAKRAARALHLLQER